MNSTNTNGFSQKASHNFSFDSTRLGLARQNVFVEDIEHIFRRTPAIISGMIRRDYGWRAKMYSYKRMNR
jgi:hypothetical protein